VEDPSQKKVKWRLERLCWHLTMLTLLMSTKRKQFLGKAYQTTLHHLRKCLRGVTNTSLTIVIEDNRSRRVNCFCRKDILRLKTSLSLDNCFCINSIFVILNYLISSNNSHFTILNSKILMNLEQSCDFPKLYLPTILWWCARVEIVVKKVLNSERESQFKQWILV